MPEYKPVRARFSRLNVGLASTASYHIGPACVIIPVEDWWPDDYFIPGERALTPSGREVEVLSLPRWSVYGYAMCDTSDGLRKATNLQRPPAKPETVQVSRAELEALRARLEELEARAK